MTDENDSVYEIEFIPDKNGLCNRKEQCVNYEYALKCEGKCSYSELEGVDKKVFCDNFYQDFKNENGLIIHLFKESGLMGERTESRVENFCCGTMMHFLLSIDYTFNDGGSSPIQIGTSDPSDEKR